MVDIQSKEVIDKISDELKVQPAMQIPRALSKDIALVYEVNPQKIANIVRNSNADGASTSVTLFTTDSKKKFYLTNAVVGIVAHGGGDTEFAEIKVIIDGVTRVVLSALVDSTANDSAVNSISFPVPILLDKSTIITLVNSSGGVSTHSRGNIVGYETDPQ